MKLFTIITALLFSVTIATAQTEATIQYEIKIASDNPEMQSQLAMMEGSSMVMYLKDGNLRQEISMGGFIENTTISNGETKETLMLTDGMGGKYAAKMKVDEDDVNDEAVDEELDIELIDETKEIVGYTCKKAIIYDVAGGENIFWYTEEINAPENGGKYMKKGIPGMALEFSIVQPQLTMTFSATEFSEKVKRPKEKFDMTIPEGYTEKSMKDFQNMLGGAQ